MEYAETLKWTGVYLGLWLVAVVGGGGLAVAGVALGGLAPLGLWAATPAALRIGGAPYVGVVLLVVGALVFKYGSAAALVHVVVSASEARLHAGLSTEAMKADILSVLDDRLSEMHTDVTETRRLVGQGTSSGSTSGGGTATGFEFEND